MATQFFTEAEANRGIILLTEAEEKSSFLGKTEAEDSVDHCSKMAKTSLV